MILPQNDVPDLLNVLHQRNETNTTISSEHNENVKNLMNNKIISLLQNIQEKNSQYDKFQLMELLRMVQASSAKSNITSEDGTKDGSQEEELSDSMIAEFVESLSAEHIELDVPKLKEILIKYEHSKLLEKNEQNTNPLSDSLMEKSGDINNNDISENRESTLLGITGGLEGSHHGLGHLRGSHIGAGIRNLEYDPGFSNTQENKGNVHEHRPHHTHHHHSHHHHKHLNSDEDKESVHLDQSSHYHHVDEAFGDGHLIKGPHGSLVIRPDNLSLNTENHNTNATDGNKSSNQHGHTDNKIPKSKQHEHEIHEKLNVNPYDLKLNQAGTMVSYGSSSSDLSSASSTSSSTSDNDNSNKEDNVNLSDTLLVTSGKLSSDD